MKAVNEITGKIENPGTKFLREVRKGYTYFKEGDVLFAKITPCMENGKSAIARNLINGLGFGSTEFHVIRPSAEIIPEWIYYFVRQKWFRGLAARNMTGSVGQQRVPKEFLENVRIPLPPLDVQRRIVARIEEITSRIEQAKKLREEVLKDTEAIMRSALHQIFSKAEENGWQRVKLKDVCAKIVGGGTPRRNNSRYFNGNIVWLTPTDLSSNGPITEICDSKTKITEEGLKNSSAQLLPAGAVVYSSRATIGKIAIAGVPLATNQGFANFVCRQDVVLNRFLAYVLKWVTPELQRMGKMTTFPEVKKSTLKLFKIPVPFKDGKPDLEEQNRIVVYLDNLQEKVEALRKYQEKTKNEIDAITQTLLMKAFRGNF